MSEEMPERFIMDVRTGVHNIENPDLYTWHQVCRVKSAEGLPGTYTPVSVQSLEELKNVLREL